MKPFGPLPRQRASDSVYEALRSGILTRVFEPGQRLNVPELASQLQVSLTPVKDALNRLASEDLIEIRPHSGTFVTQVMPEDVAETFQIRSALERLAGELAIAHATPADVAELRHLVNQMAGTVADEAAWSAHEKWNGRFHQLIIDLSRNRKLIQMYEDLNAHIQIARIHRGRQDWQERLPDERAEHEAIISAFEARDVAALQTALQNHVSRAAESLVRDLRELNAATLAAAPVKRPRRTTAGRPKS
ncbi:MAG: GntR family transcriptional regulator [Vicinamibacteria bacterium]